MKGLEEGTRGDNRGRGSGFLERGRGKDREFLKNLGKWDVMVLMETCMEERG